MHSQIQFIIQSFELQEEHKTWIPRPEAEFLCSMYIHTYLLYLNQLDKEEKQLPDRRSDGAVILSTASIPCKAPLEFDRRGLGESKLRRISFPMAKMGCSVSFVGVDDLNFLQKLMCLFNASSVDMSLSALKTSSFTA